MKMNILPMGRRFGNYEIFLSKNISVLFLTKKISNSVKQFQSYFFKLSGRRLQNRAYAET